MQGGMRNKWEGERESKMWKDKRQEGKYRVEWLINRSEDKRRREILKPKKLLIKCEA